MNNFKKKKASDNRIENIFRRNNLSLRKRVSLKKYCTFKIGGKAKYFITVRKIEKLIMAVKIAKELKLRFVVIGEGSNILFDSKGFDGLVIRNRCNMIKIRKGGVVEAHSGTTLKKLIKKCVQHSLEGFENIYGIPGTVGGAIWGNAGAYGTSISDFLDKVEILDGNGEIKTLGKRELYFGYRDSIFKRNKGVIILKVKFLLRRGKKEKILSKMIEIKEKRKKRLPPYPCAGSFFKNVLKEDGTKISAGELIEKAGLKGFRIGNAEIWSEHGNFIVNFGNATSSEILSLADKVKKEVKGKYGIELEEEVLFIPEKEVTL
ncbi:MAG: UDP-N-acetylmuramate dehydrogenase [Candidatus Aminicenantia bacterium]